MKTNTNGFLRYEGGVQVEHSNHSALSGAPLASGSYTRPLPGRPDLYYRLNAAERMSLTDEQVEQIAEKARALYPLKMKQVKIAPPEEPARGDE